MKKQVKNFYDLDLEHKIKINTLIQVICSVVLFKNTASMFR